MPPVGRVHDSTVGTVPGEIVPNFSICYQPMRVQGVVVAKRGDYDHARRFDPQLVKSKTALGGHAPRSVPHPGGSSRLRDLLNATESATNPAELETAPGRALARPTRVKSRERCLTGSPFSGDAQTNIGYDYKGNVGENGGRTVAGMYGSIEGQREGSTTPGGKPVGRVGNDVMAAQIQTWDRVVRVVAYEDGRAEIYFADRNGDNATLVGTGNFNENSLSDVHARPVPPLPPILVENRTTKRVRTRPKKRPNSGTQDDKLHCMSLFAGGGSSGGHHL